MVTAGVFYMLSLLTVIFAVFILIIRNPAHCVMSLVGLMICLAGIFLTLGSPFIAAVQVLVYAGAVMALFIFAIMILNLRAPEETKIEKSNRRIPGLLLGLLFLGQFSLVVGSIVAGSDLYKKHYLLKDLFLSIMTKYLLPFELISVLALIAIIGALMISMPEKKEETK